MRHAARAWPQAAAKKAVKEAAKAERLAAKAAERAAKQVVDDEAAAQRAVEAARKLEEEEERARQKAMEEEERERLEAQKRAEREVRAMSRVSPHLPEKARRCADRPPARPLMLPRARAITGVRGCRAQACARGSRSPGDPRQEGCAPPGTGRVECCGRRVCCGSAASTAGKASESLARAAERGH